MLKELQAGVSHRERKLKIQGADFYTVARCFMAFAFFCYFLGLVSSHDGMK